MNKRNEWSTGKTKPSITCLLFFSVAILMIMTACKQPGTSHRPTLDVPLEYADMHMPEGWWNDPKILSEGRLLYQGVTKSFVKCDKCHGRDGKPVKRGAPNFTNSRRVARFSDSYWYWRIFEGVRGTSMKPYAKKLSEQEIWKIIAYQRNFGLRGKVYNPVSDRWEDPTIAKEGGTSPTS